MKKTTTKKTAKATAKTISKELSCKLLQYCAQGLGGSRAGWVVCVWADFGIDIS